MTPTRPPPEAALRAVLRLRAALRSLRDRVVPAPVAVIERTFGAVVEARALGIAAELDVAGLLDGAPRSTAELATTTGTDPDALDRVLGLLASTGCFRRGRDGRWRNTRASRVLRATDAASMRGWARFFGGADYLRIVSAADHSVRTGESATEAVTGHPFFEWATTVDPEAGARFAAAMEDGSRAIGPSFAAVVDLDGVAVLCDVGGGTGRLVGDVLPARPGLRGIVFDLPEVVAGAPTVLAGAGVADRVEVVGGSFFESVPAADRHVLVSVLHDWDDARAVTILERCRDGLTAGGRVLVVEQVVEPGRPPFIERHGDVAMLVLTGAGRERTAAELHRLFAAAGLRVTRTWRLVTLQTVFELAP